MNGLSEQDLSREWAKAITTWLNLQRRPKTKISYTQALVSFFKPKIHWNKTDLFESILLTLDDTERKPWNITRKDLLVWQGEMKAHDNSNATINLYLSAVSSLYRFVRRDYMVPSTDGSEEPLCLGANPVETVSRPKTIVLGKATYLEDEEVIRLLAEVSKDNSVNGSRNYALLLTYLLTGRRNSEIRTLRWGDIREEKGRTIYRFIAKGGKERLSVMPPKAWDAIRKYLHAAARLQTMKGSDYIFTPLSDRALNFRRKDGTPLLEPEEWNRNRPISLREVGRIFKMYADGAGLDASRLTVTSLRHTAARAYKRIGGSVEEISEMLGHADWKTTEIYTRSTKNTIMEIPLNEVGAAWNLK